MAELNTTCCTPETQASCCGPDGNLVQVRESVRARYAAAAQSAVAGSSSGCDCSPTVALTDEHGSQVFGPVLYDDEQPDAGTAAALDASLGCGVPTAVAELHEGETVLDLGSGAGADVLISARRVAPTGKAIGIDMTDEMLQLARSNAAEARVKNVQVRREAGFEGIKIRETPDDL